MSLFAVIIPTESIFDTSSYVNVPAIETLPPNSASPVKVDTPPTLKCLSTNKSLYENVEIPDVGAPVCPIYLYPTMYMFVSVTPLGTLVSLKFRTPAE